MKEYSENGLRVGLSQNSDAQYLGLAKKLLGAVKHAASFNGLQQLQREIVLPNGVRLFASSIFGIDAVRVVSPVLAETQEAQVVGEIVGLIFLIDASGIFSTWAYGDGWSGYPSIRISAFIPAKDESTGEKGQFITDCDIEMNPDAAIDLTATVGDFLYVDSYKDVPGAINSPVFQGEASSLMPYKWRSLQDIATASIDDPLFKLRYVREDWLDKFGSNNGNVIMGFYVEFDSAQFDGSRLRFYISIGEDIDVPTAHYHDGVIDTSGGVKWTIATLSPSELPNIEQYVNSVGQTIPGHLSADSVKANKSYRVVKTGEMDTADILSLGANVNQKTTSVSGIMGNIWTNVEVGEPVSIEPTYDDVGPFLSIRAQSMPYNVADVKVSLESLSVVTVNKRIDHKDAGEPAAKLPF